MPSAHHRVTAFVRSKQGRKLLRFLAVSVVSTLVALAVIAVLYGFRIINNEVDATVVGNAVGAYPAYALNRRWTWGKSGRSHIVNEITPFWILTIAGIAFSIIGADYARHLVRTHHWSHLLNTGIVDAANIASAGVFWILKFYVFNRIFHVDEEAEIAAVLSGED
jgi:putative flippase GtrA